MSKHTFVITEFEKFLGPKTSNAVQGDFRLEMLEQAILESLYCKLTQGNYILSSQTASMYIKDDIQLWFKVLQVHDSIRQGRSFVRFKVKMLNSNYHSQFVSIIERRSIVIKRSNLMESQLSQFPMTQANPSIPPSEPETITINTSLKDLSQMSELPFTQMILSESPALVSESPILHMVQDLEIPETPPQPSAENSNDSNSLFASFTQGLSFMPSQIEQQEISFMPPSQIVPATSTPELPESWISNQQLQMVRVVEKRRKDGILFYAVQYEGMPEPSWKVYDKDWTMDEQQLALNFEKQLIRSDSCNTLGTVSTEEAIDVSTNIPWMFDIDTITDEEFYDWVKQNQRLESIQWLKQQLSSKKDEWGTFVREIFVESSFIVQD